MTDIFEAISTGDLKLLYNSIKDGANVKAVGRHKWTPLHFAAINDYHEIARVLIDNGADVNAKDCHQRTALHLAAKHENLKTTLVLFKSDVDTKVKDDDGITPYKIEFVKKAQIHYTSLEALLKYAKNNLNYNERKVVNSILQNHFDIQPSLENKTNRNHDNSTAQHYCKIKPNHEGEQVVKEENNQIIKVNGLEIKQRSLSQFKLVQSSSNQSHETFRVSRKRKNKKRPIARVMK